MLVAKQILCWHQLLCQTKSHSYTIWECFPLKNKLFKKPQALSVIKRFSRSLIHELICFQSLEIKYLHDLNISSVRGEKGNMMERKPCWKLCLCLLRVWICLNKANLWFEFSIRCNWYGTRSFLGRLILYSCTKCLAHPSRWIVGLSVWILWSFCYSWGNSKFFSLSFLRFFGLIILSCIWLCKDEFCSKDDFFCIWTITLSQSLISRIVICSGKLGPYHLS